MSNTPQSSGYELLGFYEKPHGLYLGEATVRAPSGRVGKLVYRDDGIHFSSGDPETLSGGNLLHETPVALREAVRAAYPEIFDRVAGR
jgi:hypothetical protein